MLNAEPGSPNADAYLSREDADAYHADHGNTAWQALDDVAKDAAIRYATSWLDANYRWRGTVSDSDQALGWPREGARDAEGRPLEGVPRQLRHVCAEIALAHIQESLSEPRGPRVTSESVEGAVSVTYADSAGNEGTRYPLVEGLLRGLSIGGGNAVKVRRA